ncbi:zf-HC2 domain-containing protein [uncultured Draconibacterium sp.]|uniref:anti-sigma factor family protein n=1 Tax=uncultured Draconibacterium sp. TaxID=1573823 RepID=UPI0025FCEF70|nr:zf-HC2 domain-containing protein [uncultured Draconibacterium sp.]
MNCKLAHKKLIFFVEQELPVSEMEQVRQHLKQCAPCAHFAEEMKKTLSIIEADKVEDENPFFFTRVKARLENTAGKQVAARPVLVRILQPVAFSVILLLGVYGGFKLGQTPTINAGNNAEAQELIPYWNELDAEPIETFLME